MTIYFVTHGLNRQCLYGFFFGASSSLGTIGPMVKSRLEVVMEKGHPTCCCLSRYSNWSSGRVDILGRWHLTVVFIHPQDRQLWLWRSDAMIYSPRNFGWIVRISLDLCLSFLRKSSWHFGIPNGGFFSLNWVYTSPQHHFYRAR